MDQVIANGTNNPTNGYCYASAINKEYLWEDVPVLDGPIPLLVLQMIVAIAANQICFFVVQQFHQPRIISDIIGGLLVSPSLLQSINPKLAEIIWPKKSWAVLDVLGNMGLLYTMFIQGLHMDLSPIARGGRKRTCLAFFTIAPPLVFSLALFFSVARKKSGSMPALYWGTILSSTSFPTLAHILASLKLLCNDLGRETLSVGMIKDVFGWFLTIFMLAISSTTPGNSIAFTTQTAYVLLCSLAFILCTFIVIRPIVLMLIRRNLEGENYSDYRVMFIVFLALGCGFVTEYIGSHFLLGAFVFGMSIPQGHLSSTLADKMEECMIGVLMPLYFVVIARKVNVFNFLWEMKNAWVIFLTLFIKVFSAYLASFFSDLEFRDALGVGVLLSVKGVHSLAILHIGHERHHISSRGFCVMLVLIFVTTMLAGPVATLFYKRLSKNNQSYQQRTIEGTTLNDEFRVITCTHNPCNIASIVNLLEISNNSAQCSLMSVFAVHLIELIGRASAMLVVHEARDTSSRKGATMRFFNRAHAQSEQIITAFEGYAHYHNGTLVQTLTVVSPIDSMHEDVCGIANDKQSTLIILPFHKQLGIDGNLEETNFEFGVVNENVMAKAPCSVGLLVDRGLGILALHPSSKETSTNGRNDRNEVHIAMIYIGGCDDREALSYAFRMASHPFVSLTVIRFIVGDNAVEIDPLEHPEADDIGVLTILMQGEREKELDEDFLSTLNDRTTDNKSITYVEKVSDNGEEIVSLLREMNVDYNLYIVGRGKLQLSPLTMGLVEWSDCPELGAIGDILVTSDFSSNSSVLVIQQYSKERSSENESTNSSQPLHDRNFIGARFCTF